MSSPPFYCPVCGAVNTPDAATCTACGSTLAPAGSAPMNLAGSSISGALTTPLPELHLLWGRYRLLGSVGQGGMGRVYRAEDTHLGNRLVAVKEMSAHGLSQAELADVTEGFRHEALLLAQLNHPNLPHIYEQFSVGDHWYLVMDFIEGETLEARLARTPGGHLPVQEVIQLGIQLSNVLAYLHSRQPPIVFRDLKPSNIMLTPDGRLYLIDFGIARLFKPGQVKDTVPFGSSGYAAPEQYGKAQTTPQADIYSLGATLHQLLSGTDPSQNPFVFAPLHLPGPAGLEALIFEMVQTDRSKRPPGIEYVRHELQRLATLPERPPSASLAASAPAAVPAGQTSFALPGVPARPKLQRRLPRPSVQGIVVAAVLVGLIVLIPISIPFVSSLLSPGGSVAALAPTPTPSPTPTDTPTPTPVPTDTPTQTPFPSGSAEYLVDAGTGKALFNINSHTRLPIASTTKIMTAMLAIENGGDLSEIVPITQAELDEVPQGASVAQLQAGDDNITLDYLLYALMLPSGSDAAIVIAHAIAGSTPAFVTMMNDKAHALGLADTHFSSPHGALEDGNNYSSVYDLVKLAQYAMDNSTFAAIVETQHFSLPPQTHRHLYSWDNTNQLLGMYPGANGVKTGSSDQAGFCIVFSATRKGRQLIGAELGAPSSDLLYADAIHLLNIGFGS